MNVDSELETIVEVGNDNLPSSDVVSTVNNDEEEVQVRFGLGPSAETKAPK